MENYNTFNPEKYTADELTISNMIKFFENPNLLALCNEKEINIIANVIKNHVVERAVNISKIHEKFIKTYPNKLNL